MSERNVGVAPNFTTAALTMLGINLTWIFMTIWAIWGLIPVLVLGAGINRFITWLALRRS